MFNTIIIHKNKQNKWERIFQEMLETTDFRLVRYGRGYYGLSDRQGANLSNIEEEVFQDAERVIDRIDTYIHDYFIKDLERELSNHHIVCPTEKEILNGDAPFQVMDCEWHWRLHNLLPHTDPEQGPRFIAQHQFEYDVLDLILHHSNQVDLCNISAIVTEKQMHVVSVKETYVKHFCVLASNEAEACETVDTQWNSGSLGEMSGEDYFDGSYQIDDVTQELENYPVDFEVVQNE